MRGAERAVHPALSVKVGRQKEMEVVEVLLNEVLCVVGTAVPDLWPPTTVLYRAWSVIRVAAPAHVQGSEGERERATPIQKACSNCSVEKHQKE